MIDLSIRADSPEIGIGVAIAMGIVEMSTDENDVALPQPKQGVEIYTLPPIIATPGTYDNVGAEIIAPTYFLQSHYNIRITDPDIIILAEAFIENAIDQDTKGSANKSETVYKWQGVEIVDMSTVNSPSNKWL